MLIIRQRIWVNLPKWVVLCGIWWGGFVVGWGEWICSSSVFRETERSLVWVRVVQHGGRWWVWARFVCQYSFPMCSPSCQLKIQLFCITKHTLHTMGSKPITAKASLYIYASWLFILNELWEPFPRLNTLPCIHMLIRQWKTKQLNWFVCGMLPVL